MSHPSSANPIKGLALHSLVWLDCAGLVALDVPVWLALGGCWLASRQPVAAVPDWRLPGGFDGIFCRKVMIYFDKTTQVQLLERMARLLRSDGLFFAGHAESFVQASHVVKLVSRTVYRPVTGVPA